MIDAAGGVSRQVDLVVFRTDYAPRFAIGGVPVFMLESVAAVFEVKAAVDSAADLHAALENIRSVKELDRTNGKQNYVVRAGERGSLVDQDKFDQQIFGGILTQDSLSFDSFGREYALYLKSRQRRLWPNIYVDADGWVGLLGHQGSKGELGLIDADPYAHDGFAEAKELVMVEGGDPPLLWLASTLIDYLRIARVIDFHSGHYLPISWENRTAVKI